MLKSPLNIALLGGKLAIHRFLCAYVGLMEEMSFSACAKCVDLRLYLLPAEDSDVASHLAANDGWYRRQVFTPFRHMHEMVLPSLKVDMPLEQFSRNWLVQVRAKFGLMFESAPPMLLPRNILEDYVQGAKEKYRVPVYECLCWCPNTVAGDDAIRGTFGVAPRVYEESHVATGRDPLGESADIAIPFFSRVEVGLNVAVQEFRENMQNSDANHKPPPGSPPRARVEGEDPYSWRNIMKSNVFRSKWVKTAPVDIDVRFRETNFVGNTNVLAKEHTRTTMPYASLCISSGCAYKGNADIGFDPCVPQSLNTRIDSPSLGFTATPLKGRVTDLMKKRDFNSKEAQQVRNVLNGTENIGVADNGELCTCSHNVGYLELYKHGNLDEGFKMLVDGQLYGPFKQVFVRAKEGSVGEPMDLPFMHFLKWKR